MLWRDSCNHASSRNPTPRDPGRTIGPDVRPPNHPGRSAPVDGVAGGVRARSTPDICHREAWTGRKEPEFLHGPWRARQPGCQEESSDLPDCRGPGAGPTADSLPGRQRHAQRRLALRITR